ncbi:MAG: GNAT family N-acetyltransferase [Rhizobiales bacterium]|nr:GNAT family N-acetyltransferase [Hyphomicrobiales bacterium]
MSVLTTPADVAAAADEWDELERRSNQVSFFQSSAWSMLACRIFHQLYGRDFKPLVVTVRRGCELVAVAPFRIIKTGPIRLATDLTDPFGQYSGILIAGDVNADTVVAEIIAVLRSTAGVDGLFLRRVRADSPAYAALMCRGFAASATDAAPFIDLQPCRSFEDYQKTVNVKSRKNLRNLRNRMARLAPVTHRVAVGDGVRRIIDESFEGRLRWLDEHGIPSMAFGHPAFGALLVGIRNLARRGDFSILAMGLYCGETPVSLQWGFIHRDRYYAYIAARNPEYDAYSPGRLHLEDVIRTCFERGIGTCDFLAPAARYKLTWTEQATEVVDIAVPFTIIGRLWLDVWNRRLRPAIKSRYSQLPLWLRRRIRRITTDSPSAT